MAADLAAAGEIQALLDGLDSQKDLIARCALHWKALADHFAALQETLDARTQALDVELQSLDSRSSETLESLSLREASIPERESAAAAAIQERRDAVLAEIAGAAEGATEGAAAATPTDLRGILHWFSRRMDSAALWRFVAGRKRDLALLRREIGEAVAASVDPARLVVDAIQDFLTEDVAADAGGGEAGSHDRCWVLGMLLRSMFDSDGTKAVEVSAGIKEKAAKVAEAWKEKFGGKMEGEGEKDVEGEAEGWPGRSEAQIFLQIVAAFGLKERFEQDFLKNVFAVHAKRRELARLAPMLGCEDKLQDIIEEMIKLGKEIDAAYVAHETGLTDQFSPIALLKSYLLTSRSKAYAVLKNRKRSIAAAEESNNMECSSLKSIIRCVESCKLESKFHIQGLKNRLARLEKNKVEKKKYGPSFKSPNKKPRVSGAAAPLIFPAAKASRHPAPGVPPHVAARHSYGYPAQGQSPTAIAHKYYSPEEMAARQSAYTYTAPPVKYGAYGYAAPHSAPSQPSHPH